MKYISLHTYINQPSPPCHYVRCAQYKPEPFACHSERSEESIVSRLLSTVHCLLFLGLFTSALLCIGFLFSLPALAQTCVQPPPGLVSWWPGDGDANDIIDGNPGTLMNGATFTPGKVGQAFSFDGVDDFVSIPAFNMGINWTVEGWIYPVSCSDNQHCPFFNRSNDNLDGMVITYLGPTHPTFNEVAAVIGNGSDYWQVVLTSGTKYLPNQISGIISLLRRMGIHILCM